MNSRQKQRIDPTVGIETVEQYRGAIAACLADVAREDREWHLIWLVDHLFWEFRKKMLEDAECLQTVLEIGCLLRVGTGPGRASAEKKFLGNLADLGWRGLGRLEPLEDGEFLDLVNLEQWDEEVRPIGRTMQMLCAFAEETLEFRARPRDPFAGERRRLAREILLAMRRPGEAG